jgi:hypothetical protein
MFLSFPQNDGDYETLMQELNTLKPIVDSICPSYAICVKGQAIPEPACGYGTEANGQPRFVFLKTSSYAFANCFEVEKELCKKEGIEDRLVRRQPYCPKDTGLRQM